MVGATAGAGRRFAALQALEETLAIVVNEGEILAVLLLVIFTALLFARAVLEKADEAACGGPRRDGALRPHPIVELAKVLAPAQIAHVLLLEAAEPARRARHGRGLRHETRGSIAAGLHN